MSSFPPRPLARLGVVVPAPLAAPAAALPVSILALSTGVAGVVPGWRAGRRTVSS